MNQILASPLNLVKEKFSRVIGGQRLLPILCLGFASGFPLLLTGSTLQAWYAKSNVDLVTIGILTLVGQPYAFKFLWSPLLDRYAPPFLGRRRGWILIFQVALVLSIAFMGMLNPSISPFSLAFLALFVAFLSASQDIAIDAYRTDLLQPPEWPMGIALNTIGYRLAMLVTGALALILADYIGWRLTYFVMAAILSFEILVTIKAPPIHNEEQLSPKSLRAAVLEPFKEFLKRHAAVSILFFIILYKLGDVFTLALGTTFLLRGVGFSLTEVGLIYKVLGILGTFVGSYVGARAMNKMGMFRGLWYFGVIQVLSNLPFMLLALVGKNYPLLIGTIFIETFASGLASIAFISFITSLCDHRYTATQFALFTACAVMGRVFAGPIAGLMVEHLGWVHYYFWAFMIGIPGLLMVPWLKFRNVISE